MKEMETVIALPLFSQCSKEWIIFQHPHFQQRQCPSQFQDHICFAGYMVNSTTRPNWELHRCLQQDTSNTCLSFTNISLWNVKTNSKAQQNSRVHGKTPYAPHRQRIQYFWAALRSKAPVQNRWTGHTHVQWNCHICTALGIAHMYSRTHYPTAEVLQNMGWDRQDKVK